MLKEDKERDNDGHTLIKIRWGHVVKLERKIEEHKENIEKAETKNENGTKISKESVGKKKDR